MGITLLAQAGISLGLALDVQRQFPWGRDFASLVIAIVVINQLLGPILCKIGMRRMIAEDEYASKASATTYMPRRPMAVQVASVYGAANVAEDISDITSISLHFYQRLSRTSERGEDDLPTVYRGGEPKWESDARFTEGSNLRWSLSEDGEE